MKNTTITLFVNPDSLIIMLEVLKVLDGLELENNYTFQPSDIQFSEAMISNWIFLNVPVDLYLKFRNKYNELKP